MVVQCGADSWSKFQIHEAYEVGLSLWSASPANLFSASIGALKEVRTALES